MNGVTEIRMHRDGGEQPDEARLERIESRLAHLEQASSERGWLSRLVHSIDEGVKSSRYHVRNL